jgi:ubiquitin C-terminal hydrolase
MWPPFAFLRPSTRYFGMYKFSREQPNQANRITRSNNQIRYPSVSEKSDNVKSLQDAIKSFTATEIIQDFYCSKTKQKLDAQRRTSLDQLPPILILHLKQFIYTQDHGLKKLMKRIEYPIDFELPDCCLHDKNSDKSLRNSRTYKLLAGESPGSCCHKSSTSSKYSHSCS